MARTNHAERQQHEGRTPVRRERDRVRAEVDAAVLAAPEDDAERELDAFEADWLLSRMEDLIRDTRESFGLWTLPD